MAVQSTLLGCSGRGDHPHHEEVRLQLETQASVIFELDIAGRERERIDMYKSSCKLAEFFFDFITRPALT